MEVVSTAIHGLMARRSDPRTLGAIVTNPLFVTAQRVPAVRPPVSGDSTFTEMFSSWYVAACP